MNVHRCRKCKSLLVLRLAQRGRYEGKWFLGCSRYPACSFVESITWSKYTRAEYTGLVEAVMREERRAAIQENIADEHRIGGNRKPRKRIQQHHNW